MENIINTVAIGHNINVKVYFLKLQNIHTWP